MANTNGKNGRDFSIELSSNQNLTRLQTASNGSGSGVLFEGTLGILKHAVFVEPEILEVRGNCGVLRVNLRMSEIREKNVDGGDKE